VSTWLIVIDFALFFVVVVVVVVAAAGSGICIGEIFSLSSLGVDTNCWMVVVPAAVVVVGAPPLS
jgi:hypothetical protein